MTRPEVIKMFYNAGDDYQKLQQLKQEIDPKDVFHTPLTVKLPQQESS